MQKGETVFRKRVLRDLKKLALTRPVFFEAIQQRAIRGSADFILCIRGKFIWLELKDENGHLSRVQEEKVLKVCQAWGTAIVTRPSCWQETFEMLKHLSEDP